MAHGVKQVKGLRSGFRATLICLQCRTGTFAPSWRRGHFFGHAGGEPRRSLRRRGASAGIYAERRSECAGIR